MPELSFIHIETITFDIRREGINFSHLADDIIDHVCCDVEYHMQQGLDFNEAYRLVRQKMGSTRRIREIQEETLYAVDLKYRKMKNTMKISAVAGTILFGLAVMFKIQHWPGAGIMFTLGAIILAFLFMPSALVVLWKETKDRRSVLMFVSGFLVGLFFIMGTLFKVQHWPGAGLVLTIAVFFGFVLFIPSVVASRVRAHSGEGGMAVYIAGGLGVICFLLGMFFKLQHWPLASILMVSGLIITGIVAIPWYTFITWRNEGTVNLKFIFILVAAILIMVPGTLVNLNMQRNFDSSFFVTIGKQYSLNNALRGSNDEFLNTIVDTALTKDVEKIHSATIEALSLLDNTERKMINASEGEPDAPATTSQAVTETNNGLIFSFDRLSNAFHPKPAEMFLFPGSNEREAVINKMAAYSVLAVEILPIAESAGFKALLDPSAFLPNNEEGETRIPLIIGLFNIEVLKTNILLAESAMLKEISGLTR